MFCSRCGTKLDDSAKFCPSCGSKVVTGKVDFNSNVSNIVKTGSDTVKSVDWQKLKGKTSFVFSDFISTMKGLKDSTVPATKKYFYGIVVSIVLILVFGVASLATATKVVDAEVTYASEPEQRGVHKLGDPNTYLWLQNIEAVYKNKTYTEYNLKFESKYEAYRRGDTIKLRLKDGKLERGEAYMSDTSFIFMLLTLLPIGSCIWFSLKYFKKRG